MPGDIRNIKVFWEKEIQTNVDLHNKINTGNGINEKEFLITLKNKSKIGRQAFCNGAYILGL